MSTDLEDAQPESGLGQLGPALLAQPESAKVLCTCNALYLPHSHEASGIIEE